ncbi:hypothetical protein KBY58_04355 [Cyanobium sp. HWJ4-Hawea]|uniref:hypothetical protein n=1 Tax=Cyanobium sp. HWJ4-Hawea TaxID=2823713 RepID=UPI0020CF6D78|nr:hypothetical protein [Cyanobium sp. HWJ4-Hawea]MCP9808661.1 hypothetical protein [Cyanobium sp. HWJ4-Hawea]
MSITNKCTSDEVQAIEQERRAILDLQMPSFIRGDEDEGADALFAFSVVASSAS